MSLDLTGASPYVEDKNKTYIKALIGGASTINRLITAGNVQTGVKTKAPVLVFKRNVIIQTGGACGRNPMGSTKLSDSELKVFKMKINEDYCFEELENMYFTHILLKDGADPENNVNDSFVNDLIEETIKSTNANDEITFWIGDSTSTTLPVNQRKFDGVLKQLAAPTAMSGADLVEKLQKVAMDADVNIRNQEDFYIYVGQNVADAYKLALANKNIYQPTEDLKVFGTSIKLMPTPGLNGTDIVVAGRDSNFQVGTDLRSDKENVKWKYSMETEKYYLDAYWSLGVAIVFPDETKAYNVA